MAPLRRLRRSLINSEAVPAAVPQPPTSPQAGKRVLVLEKEHFPRFHIGESLLPYNRRIFRGNGGLQTAGSGVFPASTAPSFISATPAKALKLIFQNGRFTRETTAFQVDRAQFDHILLKHAATAGPRCAKAGR